MTQRTSIDMMEDTVRTAQRIVLVYIGIAVACVIALIALKVTGHRIATRRDSVSLFMILGMLLVGMPLIGLVVHRASIRLLHRAFLTQQSMPMTWIAKTYSNVTVLRSGLALGPTLFGVTLTLMTGNLLGLAGAAVGGVLLALVFPTYARIDRYALDVIAHIPAWVDEFRKQVASRAAKRPIDEV